jgi:hypothetical protein
MKRRIATAAKVLAVVFMAWMWFFAFVLASRESANNVHDKAWSARAEAVCKVAFDKRTALADLSRIDPADTASVLRKADITARATDTLDEMLDSLASDLPSTDKGRELVPEWISDYRSYIRDRRDYVDALRKGTLVEFTESLVEGIPITERLGKFARENHMDSCQPPRDLQA